MAMAVWSAQAGRRNGQYFPDRPRLVFGTVFLGVKAIEYKQKFDHHLVPASAC